MHSFRVLLSVNVYAYFPLGFSDLDCILGGESRGIKGRHHRISCRYSDKTGSKFVHMFIYTLSNLGSVHVKYTYHLIIRGLCSF